MADRMGLLLVVEGLSDFKNATVTVQKLNDDVAKSMMGVEGASAPTQKGIKGLTMSMIKGHIAVKALSKGFNMLKSFGKKLMVQSTMLTARYDELGVVIEVIAANLGYTTQEMAVFEKGLRETGITAIGSRQALATMAQANIDLAYSTDLARVAQNAAVVARLDSTEAFERLIYAVSRGRTQVAKTMGINVDFVKSEQAMAASLGVTRKELSESDLMQARFNATMEASSSIAGAYEAAMGEAGKQSRSLARYIEDTQLAIGRAFKPAYTKIIFGLKDILQEVAEIVEENEAEIGELGTAIGDLVGMLLEMRGSLEDIELEEFLDTLTTLVRMLQVGIEEVRGWRDAWAEVAEVMKLVEYAMHPDRLLAEAFGWESIASSMNEARKEYDVLTAYQETQHQIQEDLAGSTGDLADEMKSLKEANREAARAEDDLADSMSIALELSEDQVKGIEALGEMRLDMQREYADRLIEQERDAIRQSIEISREREDIAKKYAAAVNDAYADAEKDRVDLITDGHKQLADLDRRAQKRSIEMDQDASSRREEIDRKFSQRRIDIEVKTRRRLEQISREFELSVQDAARTRDAFALVQAQRKAQREREEALRGRDEQVADAKTVRDRERQDLEKNLAAQRKQIQESLAQEKRDVAAALHEKQQAIEQQLQEALVAAEESRQQDLEAQALKLEREQEMEALQAQWEEEDRQRRLSRQLEDMERQYGRLEGVTAESLTTQIEEWAEAYGPEGAATKIVRDFAELVEEETAAMRRAMVTTGNEWADAMRMMSQVSIAGGVPLPPEFQFQSPKLGLQVGLEKLQDYLKSQPLQVFGGGRLPMAGGGTTTTRSESFSRSESRHQVDMNVPANMDAVVAKQLVNALRPALAGG